MNSEVMGTPPVGDVVGDVVGDGVVGGSLTSPDGSC